MLHTYAFPDGSCATGPSPTIPHRHSSQDLAAWQRDFRACRATIASSRQQSRQARALVEASTERIVHSRHFLTTSRAIVGCGSREYEGSMSR
jgi:SRSO17 transposase